MEPGKVKIMVVENHRAIRRPLVTFLRAAGYCVDAVENGDLALEKLVHEYRTGHLHDLLTTEIFLPGLDGLGLIDQIRAQGFTINTLIISGYRNGPMTKELNKRGCRHFLDKPFSKNEFLQQVQMLVDPEQRTFAFPGAETIKRKEANHV